jgi:hypothetical protein
MKVVAPRNQVTRVTAGENCIEVGAYSRHWALPLSPARPGSEAHEVNHARTLANAVGSPVPRGPAARTHSL